MDESGTRRAAKACAAALTPAADSPDGAGRVDIGVCRSLRITCISETGWHDTGALLGDIKAAGGMQANQWETAWQPGNGAGSASLIEIEAVDGRGYRILLDTGWDPDYMAERFAATGVDALLRRGEIDLLLISHEHFDHFWGLEAVLRLRPDITIALPASLRDEGRAFLRGGAFTPAGARNGIAHTGRLLWHGADEVHRLADGVAAVAFDLPIALGVRGEQSLYVNVAGKGIVCITGCCHQGVERFAQFARDRLAGGERLHGLYGGLHLAPFGPLDDAAQAAIRNLAEYGFERIACNHCTGAVAVEKMIELGYPVVCGSGGSGSASERYVGNGDQLRFGCGIDDEPAHGTEPASDF